MSAVEHDRGGSPVPPQQGSGTGAGIPRDMMESVFGLFTQVDSSRDRACGGLGIR